MREREHVLQLENITMQFGGVVAVNNLSLEVNKGEIVALIGPNGAGKTTAFNVITGVYQPTNGQALFHDKVYLRNHPQGKMKKGYKGENGLLYTSEYKLEGQKTKEEEKQRDHYRSDITDFEEVVELDTKYIAEWCLKLDIEILVKTVMVVFRGSGAK